MTRENTRKFSYANALVSDDDNQRLIDHPATKQHLKKQTLIRPVSELGGASLNQISIPSNLTSSWPSSLISPKARSRKIIEFTRVGFKGDESSDEEDFAPIVDNIVVEDLLSMPGYSGEEEVGCDKSVFSEKDIDILLQNYGLVDYRVRITCSSRRPTPLESSKGYRCRRKVVNSQLSYTAICNTVANL
ncbi:unnamed protein product [Arabidopsis halleri]